MMQPNYNPSVETYQPKESGAAMIEAIQTLANKVGDDVATFEGRTLSSILELVETTYDELPEFWKIWKQWHAPQPHQDMGDL